MCDPFGWKAQSRAKREAARAAEAQRAAEAKRQADITAGKGAIDNAFSQFDDAYFGDYRGKFIGNYNPQIEEQYGDAVAKLKASLAGRGMLQSTTAANQFKTLADKRNEAMLGVAGDADSAVAQLRQAIEGNKQDLYDFNKSTADPSGVEARAIGAATSLVAPPTSGTLGNLFAGALDGFSNYNAADRNAVNPSLRWNRSPTAYRSSYRVVN